MIKVTSICVLAGTRPVCEPQSKVQDQEVKTCILKHFIKKRPKYLSVNIIKETEIKLSQTLRACDT